MPSELCAYQTPIPTQIVSSDEFYPDPQNERQREVETRLLAMADELGGKQGLNRRKFFQSAAGMAASSVAMNEVYGPLFDVTRAEAATPAVAQERASALKDQFIMDMHTHFLRDDTRITTFVDMRNAVGKAGWNKGLGSREQTIEDLKFNNYKKEMFLDSDTKISLISSAPSDIEQQFPNLRGFADVADVGQAAKDWPQLNFVIYHSAYRHVGGDPKQALAEFERTGRISWTSNLADIPAQYGVSNVYGDVGQLFATTLVAEPNVCAA